MPIGWKRKRDRSVLYPVIQKQLRDKFEILIQNQITPWSFIATTAGLKLKKFNGKLISYSGIEFSGSPEHVFWGGYIEPFLEDISFSVIDEAVEKCKIKKIQLEPVLSDVQELLKLGFNSVYAHMADVDRRLKSKGYTETVSLRNVDDYVKRMEVFVSRRIKSELRNPSPWIMWIERFYENNTGLVWLIGIILAVVAILYA